MPSVSSVCLAYDERMINILSIRSHTLSFLEYVQNNNLASAYNNVCQRMRKVHDVGLAYPNVYLRIRAYDHTLMPYIRCSVTALISVY